MNKKILTAVLLFATILMLSVSSFATNTDLGTEMQDSANKTGESMQNVGEGVRNVAGDLGNGVQNMAEGIGNGIQGAVNGIGNMFDGDDANTTTGGTYTATRTSADVAGTTGMTNTAWIWLILGIVGIVIVALTWYYVSQDNGPSSRR